MGLFIAFEGGEGCGKSTQSRALYQTLQKRGVPVILTREPGGTVLGDAIRKILRRQRGETISPQAELFLFTAARIQLVTDVIRPALRAGQVVVCDRFAASTMVYQGYGRQLDRSMIERINRMATRELQPDVIFFLDLPPEEGLVRKRGLPDRFELEGLSFHRDVREGYARMAASQPRRWTTIDASLPRGRVREMVWARVKGLLNARGYL
jgi:dTMP kinase